MDGLPRSSVPETRDLVHRVHQSALDLREEVQLAREALRRSRELLDRVKPGDPFRE